MKANEAPEKLYIDSREHWMKSWTAFTTKAKGDDIEYTRTDAFIEKAVEIAREEMIKKACDTYCKVCGHYAHSVPTHICRHDCRYFSDFKKYMEE